MRGLPATPAPSVSSQSMTLAHPSAGSLFCFSGISQASSGNFQPDCVFSCCLIKATEKLFSPPAALFQGSKRNSAVIDIVERGPGAAGPNEVIGGGALHTRVRVHVERPAGLEWQPWEGPERVAGPVPPVTQAFCSLSPPPQPGPLPAGSRS